MDQLWQQFRSEARASYQLYRKEMDRSSGAESEKGLRRGLRVARDLFWTVLMKLSPARRILLLLALVFSFLGTFAFRFRAGPSGSSLAASPSASIPVPSTSWEPRASGPAICCSYSRTDWSRP